MTIGNTMTSKVLAGFVGLAMAVSFSFAGAIAANAQSDDQTVDDLRAQIQALQDQLAALQGGGSGGGTAVGCEADFTQNLSTGAQGSQVMQLQKFLNNQVDGVQVASGNAAGAPGNETNYFGPATKAAVTQFQNQNASSVLAPVGLSQGTGYWGPSSRSEANATCAAATAGSGSDSGSDSDSDSESGSGSESDDDWKDGNEASLQNFESTNEYSNEDVDEGQEEAKVAEYEFEVEDGNARVSRLDVNFESQDTQSNGETDPWDYIESVSVWHDGEMVGENDDADDEDEWDDDVDNDGDSDSLEDHEIRLSNLDTVVMDGDEPKFTIAVNVADNIDDSDLDQDFEVLVPDEGLRAVDGANVNQYIGDDSEVETFTIEADSGTLDISSSKNDPDESIVKVDENSNAGPYETFVFDMEADDADIVLEDLTVDATSTQNGGNSIENMIRTATLVVDGDEFDGDINNDATNPSSASGTINWDDDELDDQAVFADNESTDVAIELEFFEQGGVGESNRAYDNDSTIQLGVRTASVDAETEGGESATINGSAEGEQHNLLVEGVSTDLVSPTGADDGTDRNDVDGDDAKEKGSYTIKFDATAFENDAYIPNKASTSASSSDHRNGVVYSITGDTPFNGTSQNSNLDWSGKNSNETDNDNFHLSDGETKEFTLTVTLDNSGGDKGHFYGITLDELRFATTDSTNGSDFSSVTAGIDNYDTDQVELDD